MNDNSFIYKNKLIMVMGLQRSGTSALIETLGQDPELRVETEKPDGPIYDDYYLRPEPELRAHFWRIKQRVILKPISEIKRRTVDDVLHEFADYGVKVVWIYRDPINVLSSSKNKWDFPLEEIHWWIRMWNEGNQCILDSLRGPYRQQICVVRYEDLMASRHVYTDLCHFLGLSDRNNMFWRADGNKGRALLAPDLQEIVNTCTAETLAELHAQRLGLPKAQRRKFLPGSSKVYGGMAHEAWRLEAHGDSEALLLSPLSPASFRVNVKKSKGKSRSTVQLVHNPVALEAGQLYTFSCWARADRKRKIGFAVGQAHDPWENLGLYETVDLGMDWRPIRGEFVARQDESNARLIFDLAGETGIVEISDPIFLTGSRRRDELLLHKGGKARLECLPETPGAVRVVFDRAAKLPRQKIQHVSTIARVEAGKRYTVTFRARSDQPRDLAVAVTQNHAPWETHGLYEITPLTSSWRLFRFDFVPPDSDEVRLVLDLAGSDVPIELSEVDLSSTGERYQRVVSEWGVPDPNASPPVLPKVTRIELMPGTSEHLGGLTRKEWVLFENDGCTGKLVHSREKPGSFRIEPEELPAANRSGLQLNHAPIRLEAGEAYFASFWARSDEPRTIAVSVGQNHDPWDVLGLYETVELAPEWRRFHCAFTASASDDDGRIYFDLGGHAAPVEISDPVISCGAHGIFGLELHGDAVAQVGYDPSQPGAARVEIQHASGQEGTDIQLIASRLRLVRHQRYMVMFWARADETRVVNVRVGQSHEPWTDLGLNKVLQVIPMWRMFRYEFLAEAEDDAQLFFDLGLSTVDISFMNVHIAPTLPLAQRIPEQPPGTAVLEQTSPTPEVLALEMAAGQQLCLEHYPILRGKYYDLQVRLRSDRPRKLSIGVSRPFGDWSDLGFYQAIELAEEWRDFSYGFTATDDEPNAAVLINFKHGNVPVEVADLYLKEGTGDLTEEDAARIRHILDIIYPVNSDSGRNGHPTTDRSPRKETQLPEIAAAKTEKTPAPTPARKKRARRVPSSRKA